MYWNNKQKGSRKRAARRLRVYQAKLRQHEIKALARQIGYEWYSDSHEDELTAAFRRAMSKA